MSLDAKEWMLCPVPSEPLYGFCAAWPCDQLATVPVMTVNGYSEDYCPKCARDRVLNLVAS